MPLAGRVLDVGAGAGYYLHRLREFGLEDGVGVELMDERVAEARRRYPALDVRQGDASDLPFADGEFDLVTQFTVLSSILDPTLRRAVAAEMSASRARPGGSVAPSTCCRTRVCERSSGAPAARRRRPARPSRV